MRGRNLKGKLRQKNWEEYSSKREKEEEKRGGKTGTFQGSSWVKKP